MAKMGENPGRADTPTYDLGLLGTATDQVRACGLLGLMWAHDADLHDPGSGVTLADYAAVIARLPNAR